MPKRALVERRPWLLASILAAMVYAMLRDEPVGGLYLIAFKGAAVGMLAVYAWLRHAGRDAAILTASLALAACGDIAFELGEGWAVYLAYASNLAAQVLFLHNLRPNPAGSQKAASAALLLLTPAIGYGLAATRPDALDVALSALVLGAMAGTAWISRFPRYRVGMGALLLVASQLLSIATSAQTGQGDLSATAVWPLFYLGQLMICTGVIQTLRRDHQA